MKPKRILPNWPVWLAIALLACALRLPAQTAPVITTQPASQTNLAGAAASFTVAVSGTGPFTYQWQFNGVALPCNLITTVAGNGGGACAGDGGAATNASINSPQSVALDAVGNLYIADCNNNRIRKVDTNGVITTVAGNGSAAYAGDGGPATNASLDLPCGVALDAAGNLYIADQANERIRMVATNGLITTVAGNGGMGYTGDGGAATNTSLNNPQGVALDATGNLYIADQSNQRIRKVDLNGLITTVAGNGKAAYAGDGGAATNASLWNPQGVAFDALGNLFIADWYNSYVRKVDTNGLIISVAGNGTTFFCGDGGEAANACLNNPQSVVLDALGNLYIADRSNQRIRQVDTNGLIATVAGNGNAAYAGDGAAATNASLNNPQGVALDAAGNLYIADRDNQRIREVQFAGSPLLVVPGLSSANSGNYTVLITSPYGSVTSTAAVLSVVAPPAIVDPPAGQVVLAGGDATFSVTATGTPPIYYSWYLAGTNLVQSGTNNVLTLSDVAMNQAGNYTVVVTDAFLSVTSAPAALAVVLPPSVTTQPAGQTNLGGTTASFSVAVSGTGPFTYQWQFNGTNLPNGLITTVAGNGYESLAGDGGPATNASLYFPHGAVWDGAGNLYIADQSNNRIRKVNPAGVITTVAGKYGGGFAGDGGAATNASLNNPAGVMMDAAGNLYIADMINYRIRRVDTNGVITTVAGNGGHGWSGDGGAATNASLSVPTGVAFDAADNMYIADYGNSRIRRVDTNGLITTVAGSGYTGFYGDGGAATNANLAFPAGVAFDAAGNLYVADTDNNRIRRVDTNGVITTVAGDNSNGGYSGDGGLAVNAGLYLPSGVAVDAYGNLYVADQDNHRVRQVSAGGLITTVAGTGYPGFYGDGGPSTNALVAAPYGVTLDPAGNLYIADTYNQRIRKVWYYAGYPTLTLSQVGAANAGNYSVVVTSACGSVTSSVAALTLVFPPAISAQPASQIVLAGGSPAVSVTATGTLPLNYAWYFGGTNLVQSGTNNTLTLPNVAAGNAGSYSVVITNNYGGVTSQVAALTVVTLQTGGQTNLPGTTANFNVTVAGPGPCSYQWRFNGANLANNVITTVAGNGTAAYAGDGGSATSASLYLPSGAAFDAAGNLYVADYDNNRIRRVNLNGQITTVAGNGIGTYAGDGGAAISAGLYGPTGVACDAAGNLYVADLAESRIRRVDTNGVITTVAGNGTAAYAGDGGAATNASLNVPTGVACDAAGNLYIADKVNDLVRRVDTNGIITTYAGNGTAAYAGDGGPATNASLWYPAGVACDSLGNLYIADQNNQRIRQVAANGIITTVAGNGGTGSSGDGGPATNATLDLPADVTVDAAGNLYVADYENNRIRMVNTNGFISTVAGKTVAGYSGDGGAPTNATLDLPAGVAVDGSGNLYIADSHNQRLRKVWLYGVQPALALGPVSLANAGNYSVVVTNASGSVTSAGVTLTVAAPPVITFQPVNQTVALRANTSLSVSVTGSGPFGYAWYWNGTNLVQSGPTIMLAVTNVSAGNAGPYFVVITNNYGAVTSQVAAVTMTGPPTVAAQPVSQTNLIGSTVTFSVTPGAGSAGPFTYQWRFNGTNLTNGIINTVAGKNATGFAGDGGPATNASLDFPSGLAFDAAGNLYIADYGNSRIRLVTPGGLITTVAGKNGSGYSGDGVPATNATLQNPAGVAFDATGNLYIADQYNNRIRQVATNGLITTVAGRSGQGYSGDLGAATNATLYYPSGVVLDSAGNLYIADKNNERVRRVGVNGVISTVAGNGTAAYGGDGGPAASTSLYYPSGVAWDGTGNLYIADYENNRIRQVNPGGLIATVAGKTGSGYAGDGGAATNATLYYPSGTAFDPQSNLYVADSDNNRIRMVTPGGLITTVAGKSSSGYAGDGGAATNATLSDPTGVAFDAYGNLYIADRGNNRVRKVLLYAGYPTLTLGQLSATNAGNYSVVITSSYGSVTSAVAALTLFLPPAITAQPASQLAGVGGVASFSVAVTNYPPFNYAWYFNNTNPVQNGTNLTLTLSNLATNNAGLYSVVITNNYGSVTSQVATLTVGYPPSVAVPPASQTNLAGTAASFTVTPVGPGPFAYQWQFNGNNLPNNLITTVAGNGRWGYAGDGGAATNASLSAPTRLAFDSAGNLYIADSQNSRIRMVNTNGIITTVAGNGSQGYSGDGGAATNATLYWPAGIALDAAGELYIADNFNNRIRKVATNGIITTVAGDGPSNSQNGGSYSGDGGLAVNAGINAPNALVFDISGNLYFADSQNNRIRKVTPNGIITTVAGNGTNGFAGDAGPATSASLAYPIGLTLDAHGNLLIGDSSNHRVREAAPNGLITTVAGNGTNAFAGDGGPAANADLNYPEGVAFDISGNVYIADTINSRIRMVGANNIITTVAGNGGSGYSGDGGMATNASLFYPMGLAWDASGNLYIADFNNNRVRKLYLAGFPVLTLTNVTTTSAGNYAVVITSPYGSVTSAVVSLTVTIPTTPPQIITGDGGFGLLTNQFGFNLNGAYGQTIVVDGSTNLLDWTPLFTNTANGAPFYFFDPAWTNFPWRFYRARLP